MVGMLLVSAILAGVIVFGLLCLLLGSIVTAGVSVLYNLCDYHADYNF